MINRKTVLSNQFIQITKTYYKDGAEMKSHYHDFTSISIVLNGKLDEWVNSAHMIGGVAQTTIKPAGLIHKNYFSKDCHILSINLSDACILNEKAQTLLSKWQWINNVECIEFFISILKCKSDFDYLELVNKWMTHLATVVENRQHFLVPPWLIEVKNHLDEHYDLPIRSDDLALAFGVHRVYLARVFRKFYGTSIKEYLNAVRLHNAIGMITMNSQSLTQTALANGYSDQSHFNRKFKESLSLTPTELRQLTK